VTEFVALLITGAVSGAIYSLIAAGTVLNYSISGVFNFAYGAIAFSVAFSFYELNTGLGWPVWASAVACLAVIAPLMGWVLDLLVFRRLSRADDTAKIVATIGLSIALPALAYWLSQEVSALLRLNLPTGDNVVLPVGLGPVPKLIWHPFTGVVIDSTQLIILVSAAVIAGLLWYLQMGTRLGLRMRAMVDRRSLASIRGVNLSRTSAIGWVIGVTLAGFTGIVAAPILALAPGSYTAIFFVAATAAVIAGLRSLPLALLGGLLLGIGQNLVAGYATFAQSVVGLSTAVPFIFLLVGLLIMSRDRARVAGVAAASPPVNSYIDDLPPWRRRAPWVVAALLLAIYSLFIADQLWLGLIISGLALAVVLLSFIVVVGLGGMVSLAQAALVTVSALVCGLLLAHGVPFVFAGLGGVGASTVLGAVLSLPAMRLGGLALALTTLAIALVADAILFQWNLLSNGPIGWNFPDISLGPVDFADQRTEAIFLALVIGVVVLLIRNLQQSATGRAMLAVRSSSVAAATTGISPVRSKLLVFCFSAAIAGLGGVMLSVVNLGITNIQYTAPAGLTWLAAVVLFGVRRPGGAVLAALAISVGPEVLGLATQSSYIPDMLFGLGAIALAQNPDGAIADVSQKLRRLRTRRQMRVSLASESSAPAVDTALANTSTQQRGPAAATLESSEVSLRISGINAGYGPVPVLHDIRLDVPRGRISVLLGSNGAGKSTLCAVLAGLHTQSSGMISLDGVDISGWSPDRRATAGLVLAPESRGIFPRLTVSENINVWLHTREERDQVYERFPNLAARRKVLAGSLSGGEQQMLAIAPVVVRRPHVLVADEPSLGLAPRVADEVMQTIALLRDAGTAVLVVEERPKRILSIADDVAFLELGRVTWRGAVADVSEEMLAMNAMGSHMTVKEPIFAELSSAVTILNGRTGS
jgi:ABC-type branched-subunit amino acid transport system ATPase component/branched-subunit amino acid ABC-type transport system permease component